MAENLTPQNQQDEDLSVEELDQVAGGVYSDSDSDIIVDKPNTNCGTNCHCG